ncbi:MAG: hypothetical protein M0027_12620 [Candidatus Dormibacteraeota bacterium]|jgi:hypothetical protein|nr:hypothetical protein [Candidatus Dormibacteraeota bacterium]
MTNEGSLESPTRALGVRLTAAQHAWLSQQPGTPSSVIRHLLEREVQQPSPLPVGEDPVLGEGPRPAPARKPLKASAGQADLLALAAQVSELVAAVARLDQQIAEMAEQRSWSPPPVGEEPGKGEGPPPPVPASPVAWRGPTPEEAARVAAIFARRQRPS